MNARAALGTFPYPARTVAEVDTDENRCNLCGQDSRLPCLYPECRAQPAERDRRWCESCLNHVGANDRCLQALCPRKRRA